MDYHLQNEKTEAKMMYLKDEIEDLRIEEVWEKVVEVM